jgi:large subunit ribosomal protein L29
VASKKLETVRNLSADELRARQGEIEANLFKLRMQLSTGQLSNVAAIWKARKELAQVKTVLNQKNGSR